MGSTTTLKCDRVQNPYGSLHFNQNGVCSFEVPTIIVLVLLLSTITGTVSLSYLPTELVVFCFGTASDETVTDGFPLLGKVFDKPRFVITTFLT